MPAMTVVVAVETAVTLPTCLPVSPVAGCCLKCRPTTTGRTLVLVPTMMMPTLRAVAAWPPTTACGTGRCAKPRGGALVAAGDAAQIPAQAVLAAVHLHYRICPVLTPHFVHRCSLLLLQHCLQVRRRLLARAVATCRARTAQPH